MRILSLFAGIGSFEKALKNLGIPCEIVAFSEIDKYAVQSYCAVHNVDSSLNLGDISKIDIKKLPKDIDIVTHGSPCQDFSVAGKNQGGDKGSKTRSSLMWCTVDIVEEVKPKIVLWENVKNVISKKHRHNFDAYVEVMDNLGYNSYFEVLNAKDFGVPQNRERVFTVSIRKDIDNKKFKFPQGFPLTKKLKDVLEKNVDEKYYLSDEIQKRFKSHGNILGDIGFIMKGDCGKKHQSNTVYHEYGYSRTLTAVDYKSPEMVLTNGAIRGRYNENGEIEQQLELRNDGVTNTLTTVEKDNVIVKNNELTKIGCIGADSQGNRVYDTNGISCTQVGQAGGLGAKTGLYEDKFRIITKDIQERTKILSDVPERVDFLFNNEITRDISSMFKKGIDKEKTILV